MAKSTLRAAHPRQGEIHPKEPGDDYAGQRHCPPDGESVLAAENAAQGKNLSIDLERTYSGISERLRNFGREFVLVKIAAPAIGCVFSVLGNVRDFLDVVIGLQMILP
jgi:hypothetical protein